MIEDLMPFFFMLAGMVAIGITLIVVTIKKSMDSANEYRNSLYRDEDVMRRDPETSAGRGSGFQG
jgi:hypothetical protein